MEQAAGRPAPPRFERRSKFVDWNRIERDRAARFPPLPADATDQEIADRNAAIDADKERPGRWLPYSKGRDAGGKKFEKERYVQDYEMTPDELELDKDEQENAALGNGALPASSRVDDLRSGNNKPSAQTALEQSGRTAGNLALKPQTETPVLPFRRPQAVPPPAAPEFDKKLWKLSRERPGFLIRRIDGYDITEDKYGISYLFRLKGGATTTTQGEHSGYYNWLALEAAGRFKKVGEE